MRQPKKLCSDLNTLEILRSLHAQDPLQRLTMPEEMRVEPLTADHFDELAAISDVDRSELDTHFVEGYRLRVRKTGQVVAFCFSIQEENKPETFQIMGPYFRVRLPEDTEDRIRLAAKIRSTVGKIMTKALRKKKPKESGSLGGAFLDSSRAKRTTKLSRRTTTLDAAAHPEEQDLFGKTQKGRSTRKR